MYGQVYFSFGYGWVELWASKFQVEEGFKEVGRYTVPYQYIDVLAIILYKVNYYELIILCVEWFGGVK